MATAYEVDATGLIAKIAGELQKEIKEPEWAKFVKTGVAKERPPQQKDWYFVRAASVMLKLYKQGPIGVSRLRTHYRSKKNRGAKPEKSYKTSGKIIRSIVQALGEAGYVAIDKGAGRKLTSKGQAFVNRLAKNG